MDEDTKYKVQIAARTYFSSEAEESWPTTLNALSISISVFLALLDERETENVKTKQSNFDELFEIAFNAAEEASMTKPEWREIKYLEMLKPKTRERWLRVAEIFASRPSD